VCIHDGKIGGLAQQHDGKGGTRSAWHDQQICPGITAGEGHDAETSGFPTGGGRDAAPVEQVEVRYTLQAGTS